MNTIAFLLPSGIVCKVAFYSIHGGTILNHPDMAHVLSEAKSNNYPESIWAALETCKDDIPVSITFARTVREIQFYNHKYKPKAFDLSGKDLQFLNEEIGRQSITFTREEIVEEIKDWAHG